MLDRKLDKIQQCMVNAQLFLTQIVDFHLIAEDGRLNLSVNGRMLNRGAVAGMLTLGPVVSMVNGGAVGCVMDPVS